MSKIKKAIKHTKLFKDEIVGFKKSLTGYEKHLFILFFESGWSSRRIATEVSKNGLNLSHATYCRFIKEIKEKLKKWKQ